MPLSQPTFSVTPKGVCLSEDVRGSSCGSAGIQPHCYQRIERGWHDPPFEANIEESDD